MSATHIVGRFNEGIALVLGDAMLDSYLEGSARRLCREGPVPVVQRQSEDHAPGGAANTAANVRALGAEAFLLAVVGTDAPGHALQTALHDRSVDTHWIVEDPDFATLHKMRVLADDHYLVRFDTGVAWKPSARAEALLLARLQEAHAAANVVIVSDYGYGVLSPKIIDGLRRLQAARPLPLIIDGKDLRRCAALSAMAVTPNHAEAAALTEPGGDGTGRPNPEAVERTARKVLEVIDTEWAAVTMGDMGVMLVGRDGNATHHPAHPVAHANDVGAGDSFTASFALALAAGASAPQAAGIAVQAAGIAVTKRRTAIVNGSELLQRVSVSETWDHTPLVALTRLVERDRRAGRTVVFTNGVFDILHAGHVALLSAAKDLGDVLVVGINSDRSARVLKGEGRPVNSARDRAALVAALDAVDHVVIFDEETPIRTLHALRPHIHVKGGDYEGQALPEEEAVRECGGRTVILPLAGAASTSELIHRIVRLADHAGRGVA